MTVVRLSELERIEVGGLRWHPLREALGVTAFKTNAYSADAGEPLIEPHTEASTGQEEMYVLVSGAATFDHDGSDVAVGAGSVVFYHPDSPDLRYDLARAAALAGDHEAALAHWRAVLALEPAAREWAADDDALAGIRDSR